MVKHNVPPGRKTALESISDVREADILHFKSLGLPDRGGQLRKRSIETRKFMQVREEYFAGDAAYSALQQALLANPELGSVMLGCGGLRKMRWPDPRRGKGKRGGLRIIYLDVPDKQVILFLKVYDEADNLTSDERKALAQTARDLREAAMQRD